MFLRCIGITVIILDCLSWDKGSTPLCTACLYSSVGQNSRFVILRPVFESRWRLYGLFVQWLGHEIFILKTAVRFCYRLPIKLIEEKLTFNWKLNGSQIAQRMMRIVFCKVIDKTIMIIAIISLSIPSYVREVDRDYVRGIVRGCSSKDEQMTVNYWVWVRFPSSPQT